MSEKRFIGCFEGDMLVSIKDTVTDRQLNILQIVEIANKIYDKNEQLKQELESFEQVSFTDLCDGSRTTLYMKKENVGDSE